MKFEELREKYTSFIYDRYEIEEDEDNLTIFYYFEIPGLSEFRPKLVFPKNIIKTLASITHK